MRHIINLPTQPQLKMFMTQPQHPKEQPSHQPSKYDDLLSKLSNGGLTDLTQYIDLFQHLLDTDLIFHMSDQMRKTADYLVKEGFCYYVPSQDMEQRE